MSDSKYSDQREIFKKFKTIVSKSEKKTIRNLYVNAVEDVLSKYDMGIRENRMVAGTAIEILTGAFINSAGLNCKVDLKRNGLFFKNNCVLSVRGSFSNTKEIILKNYLSENKSGWETATLFIIPKKGIIYGDPEYFGIDPSVRKNGHRALSRDYIETLMEEDDFVLELKDLKLKTEIEITPPARKVSFSVVEEILRSDPYKVLRESSPIPKAIETKRNK